MRKSLAMQWKTLPWTLGSQLMKMHSNIASFLALSPRLASIWPESRIVFTKVGMVLGHQMVKRQGKSESCSWSLSRVRNTEQWECCLMNWYVSSLFDCTEDSISSLKMAHKGNYVYALILLYTETTERVCLCWRSNECGDGPDDIQ